MYCLVTPLKALSFLISTPRSSIPIFVPFSHHRTFFLPAQSQIPCLRIIVEQSWKPPRWFYSNNLTLQKETESERYSLILPRFPPPPPPPLSHKATTCCCCCCIVTSVVSDSVQPHRQQPTRLPHPWDSPGKSTGVGCHCLLQCMKVNRESEVAQSCLTLSDSMDCSTPGSSVHGIFQARVLEWGAIAFSIILLKY